MKTIQVIQARKRANSVVSLYSVQSYHGAKPGKRPQPLNQAMKELAEIIWNKGGFRFIIAAPIHRFTFTTILLSRSGLRAETGRSRDTRREE